MKKKKLSNLMLKNYVLVYFMITLITILCIIFMIIFAIKYYVKTKTLKDFDRYDFINSANMPDDYRQIDFSEVIEKHGFVMIIDGSTYKVLYSDGNVPSKVSEFTKEEYNNLLINKGLTNNNYVYTLKYNKNKDFLLIIAVPFKTYFKTFFNEDKLKPTTFFYISLLLYSFVFLFSMILYSRMTAKTFTTPLKKLMNGVKNLSNGNYSTRIELKSENEFGELRDAFNFMAEKIEEEKNLKERSEELRRRLIMDISHDLKNPLASVIGYSDFLIKNQNIGEEDRNKYLTVIQKNSERANGLIIDLFELSKLESIDFKMNLKSVDICEFLRETIAAYIPEMEEKGVEYDFDIPDKSIYTLIDEKNMDRAISNLIINSMKYNSHNIKIDVIIKEGNQDVYIIIKDNGIGISEELTEKIFEPFFRVDSCRNSESGGTGLGLAITKSIINKHNGNIELNSTINKGCEFIIKLKKN